MLRAELREMAAARVNQAATDAAGFYEDLDAQQELLRTRDAAVGELKEMAAAFIAPVMAHLLERQDLAPDDYAALVVEDPEEVLPNVIKHERQPGNGAGRLVLDINLGTWGKDRFSDFSIGDVLPPRDEGGSSEVDAQEGNLPDPQEVTGVAVRAFWGLVTPTDHRGRSHEWKQGGPEEFYGLVSQELGEAANMPISIPPRPEEELAVGALLRAVEAQRETFDETLQLFEELRSGAPVKAVEAPEAVDDPQTGLLATEPQAAIVA